MYAYLSHMTGKPYRGFQQKGKSFASEALGRENGLSKTKKAPKAPFSLRS